VVLEKLKGGCRQTNTEVIEYVYFTIKVDKDNRNRTGLVERCLRKRPRSGHSRFTHSVGTARVGTFDVSSARHGGIGGPC
jgi:hypothetical protein